jgi:ABC-type Fe3+ transport system permease subunit
MDEHNHSVKRDKGSGIMAVLSLIGGVISGALGASLCAAGMDMGFGLNVALRSFFMVFPRSFVLGGIPGLVAAGIVLLISYAVEKRRGRMGRVKYTIIYCAIVGLVIGIVAGPVLYISYGM